MRTGSARQTTDHLIIMKNPHSILRSTPPACGDVPPARVRPQLTPSSHPADPNRLLSSYTVKKDLGEGTFGKVKLAVHNATKEKVAIKVLEKSKILDEGDRTRVSREVQILKLLRHPHIVQLFEIIEDGTHLYLVMEYAAGGELFDYIVSRHRLKEVEACRFFQQLIDGVEYIHRLKIVHRDLKPENLLLDENQNLKIVDFGLSNLYAEGQLLKTACGSPCYAAPEMIAGRSYEAARVDVWSAGVILFALICGYLPFDDNDTQTLYKRILRGEYTIPDFVSPSAADLLRHVLCTDPDRRYTLDQIKSHKWFATHQGYTPSPKGLLVGLHEVPVDGKIVDHVTALNHDREAVVNALRANKHSPTTTLYYLLLRKFVRKEGYVTTEDVHSPFFRPKAAPGRGEKAVDAPLRVNLVLRQHHLTIHEKMQKASMQQLNVTQHQVAEGDGVVGAEAVTRVRLTPAADLARLDHRRGNRTQLVGKVEQNRSKRARNDSMSAPKDASRQSHQAPLPLASLRSALKSRLPAAVARRSADQSVTEPAHVQRSLLLRSVHLTEKSVQPRSSVVATLNTSQRQSAKRPTTVPTFSFTSTKPRKETRTTPSVCDQRARDVPVHRGAVNLRTVSLRGADELVEHVRQVLAGLSVETKPFGPYGFRCEVGELRFAVEVAVLEALPNVHMVKCCKTNQMDERFQSICHNIFSKLVL